ncbi:MAG: hypothetical protein ABIC82_03315 [bacterium]
MAFLAAVLVAILLFVVYKKWNNHFRKALIGVFVLLIVGIAIAAIQQSKKTSPPPTSVTTATASTNPITSPVTFTQIFFEYWWLILAFIFLGGMWWWKGQKWENPFLFLLNATFLAFYYFKLPKILQSEIFLSSPLSIILVIESVFVLAVIGVIYFLYSSESPSQRKKAYTILNTVGVIFCLLISWQNVTFFDSAKNPKAAVAKKNGVVSEVFFSDPNLSFSPATGAKLHPIQPADVEQARRLVVTGSDLVRWIPWVNEYFSPPRRQPFEEQYGCEQLTVYGQKFNPGKDYVVITSINSKVVGAVARWGDGKVVKVGNGRIVETRPPLRLCSNDPNMVITYKVMKQP